MASILLGLVLFGLATPSLQAAEAGRKLKILTTILPAYCIAANVAGGVADVTNLLSGADEPHDYQLSPSDMRMISSADVIVLNGLGLESWLEKGLRDKRKTAVVIDLSKALKADLITGSSGANPHYWLDPLLAAKTANYLADELARVQPAHRAQFTSNAGSFGKRLEVLHQELERRLRPMQALSFIAYHDAFSYFARRYAIQIVGLVENTAEVPPSPRELAKLREVVKSKHVTGLLVTGTEGQRLAAQICRDMKISRIELSTLETGNAEKDAYEKAMRSNADAFLKLPPNP